MWAWALHAANNPATFCTQDTHPPAFASSHLSNDALDQLVHGKGDVGVNGEHFTQGVLVLRRVHVPVQEVAHHVQEGRVIILNINVHCNKRERER